MASTDKSPPGVNGRRGAFQLLFSAIYLVIGVSFLLLPGSASRADALAYITDVMPIQPFACLWVAAAVIGFVSAFLCRPRDWIGFFALVLAPALWGCLFLVGVVFAGAPVLGAVSGLIYWVFAAAPMVVSGMQGPNDRDTRDVTL